MFAIRQGESSGEMERRRERESEQQRNALINRDRENQVSEVSRIAMNETTVALRREKLLQTLNETMHDYAAIMRGRAECPEYFLQLPSDVECRKALGLPELTEDERREILKTRRNKL